MLVVNVWVRLCAFRWWLKRTTARNKIYVFFFLHIYFFLINFLSFLLFCDRDLTPSAHQNFFPVTKSRLNQKIKWKIKIKNVKKLKKKKNYFAACYAFILNKNCTVFDLLWYVTTIKQVRKLFAKPPLLIILTEFNKIVKL